MLDAINVPPGIKLQKTLRGHQDRIIRLAWLPDTRFLVSSSFDQTIRFWDTETGKLLRTLKGTPNGTLNYVWSPDGQTLATEFGSGVIRLWDSNSRDYKTFNLDTDVRGMAWSFDGNILATLTDNNMIWLWDTQTVQPIHTLVGHLDRINAMVWHPDGQTLATCSNDSTVRLWNTKSGKQDNSPLKHFNKVYSLAWSPDFQIIATGSSDGTISLWDTKTRLQKRILEGHTGTVNAISFSHDGQILASKSTDGSVRFWHCDTWETIGILDDSASESWTPGIAFNPERLVLATVGYGDTVICLWDFDVPQLRGMSPTINSLQYINAKVVLVGESGVGKSGLFIRIVESQFRPTISTHGAQFAQLPLPKGSVKIGDLDVEAEITLWDLAGQPEYHLIHQLFLDDADIALLLFDCSDATDPFRGVPYWAKVLKKQTPSHTIKYLISARTDVSPVTVDQHEINRILNEYKLHKHISTSARTAAGITTLLKAIETSIPWAKLPRTTTPRLFQVIRKFLFECKEKGITLISMRQIRHRASMLYTQQADIDIEAEAFINKLYKHLQDIQRTSNESRTKLQLMIDGVVSLFKTTGKKPSIYDERENIDTILQPFLNNLSEDVLSNSARPRIFQAVKELLLAQNIWHQDNDGIFELIMSKEEMQNEIRKRYITQSEVYTVVALLQARGLVHRLDPTPNLSLILLQPERLNQYAAAIIRAARNQAGGFGAILERAVIAADFPLTGIDRLDFEDEKFLLESTVELFIRHDLCFREMGMLVFPSQLNLSPPEKDDQPRAEVSYQFSGSIESIYASLVIRLSNTDYFQRESLWKYMAEFSRMDNRLGFIMKPVEEGTGSLEIYFSSNVNDFDRVTFIRFITDHLRSKGIDIRERIRLYCPECDKEVVNQEAIEARVQTGKLDIPCQYCDNSILIPRSIEEKYQSDKAFVQKQHELHQRVELRTKEEIENFKRDQHQYTLAQDNRLYILHLSDLHLDREGTARKYREQLTLDLLDELKVRRLDYLIISGDLTQQATKEEYEITFNLINELVKQFGLDPNRIIVVPGNHDVNWDISEQAYPFVSKRKLPKILPDGQYISAGEAGALVRNDSEYKRRFDNFSTYFYKKVFTRQSYSLDYDEQATILRRNDDRILFLSLNSCWNIDHHFTDRTSINIDALSRTLRELEDKDYSDWLKIAVWHHPIKMMDPEFLDYLRDHKFTIGIHGHIHQPDEGFYQYLEPYEIHLISAGTFGTRTTANAPKQYNLLVIDPEMNSLTVETRKWENSYGDQQIKNPGLKTANGVWTSDLRWGEGNNLSSRYTINLENYTGSNPTQLYVQSTTQIPAEPKSTKPLVFVSYSHKDEREKDLLLSHLGVLQQANLINTWSDDQIDAGSNWEQEIFDAMAQAKVAILLVTANFLTSEFILKKEVHTILNRRKDEGVIIIPIIAKHCAWRAVDWLIKMNVRPKNGQPVWNSDSSHVDVDKYLASIAEEVADIVLNWQKKN